MPAPCSRRGPSARWDAVLGLHLDTTLPAGTVAMARGTVDARCAQFAVTVEGEAESRRGSGQAPVDATSPRQQKPSWPSSGFRRKWPGQSVAAVTMVEGARAPNVVPSRTVVRGTLRGLEPETAHESAE